MTRTTNNAVPTGAVVSHLVSSSAGLLAERVDWDGEHLELDIMTRNATTNEKGR